MDDDTPEQFSHIQELPSKKRTKSDVIRSTTMQEYLVAESKPNGNGWKGFFRSNLFTGLVIWMLSQAVILTGVVISYYYKTSSLAEWKGETAATIKRMDEQGSIRGQYWQKQQEKDDNQQNKDISAIDVRLKEVEKDTRELPLMKATEVQLLRDVDELKHGKK